MDLTSKNFVTGEKLGYYDRELKKYLATTPLGYQGDLAKLYEVRLPVSFNLGRVGQESDPLDVVNAELNLNSFPTQVGSSQIWYKQPTAEVGPIAWSGVVDDYNSESGTANVGVIFADGSKIVQQARFTRFLPGGRIYGVTWAANDPGYIDTGLTLNYGYRFKVRGYAKPGGTMGVLIGAFSSTTERTQARQLGSSNKFQIQWSAGSDVTQETSGIDVNKEFEYTIGANYFNVKQGSVDYTQTTFSNHKTSGTNSTIPILLLNETKTGTNYVNSIGCEWVIYDTDHTTILRHMMPYHLADDEIVILDVNGLTKENIDDIIVNGDSSAFASRIYRPGAGTLVEVDAA